MYIRGVYQQATLLHEYRQHQGVVVLKGLVSCVFILYWMVEEMCGEYWGQVGSWTWNRARVRVM